MATVQNSFIFSSTGLKLSISIHENEQPILTIQNEQTLSSITLTHEQFKALLTMQHLICEGYGVMRDMYERGERGRCISHNDVDDGNVLIECLKKTDLFCSTNQEKIGNEQVNQDEKCEPITNFDNLMPPLLFPQDPLLSPNYEMI